MEKEHDKDVGYNFWWSIWDLLQGFIISNVKYDWEKGEITNKKEYIKSNKKGVENDRK